MGNGKDGRPDRRENWTCGTVGQRCPNEGREDARADHGHCLRQHRPEGVRRDVDRQLCERFLDEDEGILDTLEARARELSDDPLQSFLIFLNLYAQMMDDMEALHPGCMVATVTYQERMFDRDVCQMNVDYLSRMRGRFARWL